MTYGALQLHFFTFDILHTDMYEYIDMDLANANWFSKVIV